MKGDFSWETKYQDRKSEIERLEDFLFSKKEGKLIRERMLKQDPKWEDDARALYNKLNP